MNGEISEAKLRRYAQRRRTNMIAQVLSVLAMVFGIFWLLWILFDTFHQGIVGLGWNIFSQMTPAPDDLQGGLLNAIVGSSTMVVLATIIGTPIGILTGVYLAEFETKGNLAVVIRLVNDVLLSAPSIVIGLFVYMIIVVPMKSYSGFAGSVALALLIIPVVIRTTENMLLLVPSSLREAAYALGTPKWKVVLRITLKSAQAGVLTGVLLALARVAGETAPLLFTALSNQFWSSHLSSPMASLPVTIYKFAMSPYEIWQKLAWVAVFLITIAVFALNIIARYILRVK